MRRLVVCAALVAAGCGCYPSAEKIARAVVDELELREQQDRTPEEQAEHVRRRVEAARERDRGGR